MTAGRSVSFGERPRVNALSIWLARAPPLHWREFAEVVESVHLVQEMGRTRGRWEEGRAFRWKKKVEHLSLFK